MEKYWSLKTGEKLENLSRSRYTGGLMGILISQKNVFLEKMMEPKH